MSDDDQSGNNKGEITAAEMEERLEARLMERVMKKVNEQLASQQPATSQEKGQSVFGAVAWECGQTGNAELMGAAEY